MDQSDPNSISNPGIGRSNPRQDTLDDFGLGGAPGGSPPGSWGYFDLTSFDDDPSMGSSRWNPHEQGSSFATYPQSSTAANAHGHPPAATMSLSRTPPGPSESAGAMEAEPGPSSQPPPGGSIQAAKVLKHGKKVLRCEKNSCNCGKVFDRNQNLLRHVARSTKKWVCEEPSCPRTSRTGEKPCFGSKSDLKRHYSDIHKVDLLGRSARTFPCPHPSCDRSTNPFPREINLANHLKNRHRSLEQAPPGNNNGTGTGTGTSAMPAHHLHAAPHTIHPGSISTDMLSNEAFASHQPGQSMYAAAAQDFPENEFMNEMMMRDDGNENADIYLGVLNKLNSEEAELSRKLKMLHAEQRYFTAKLEDMRKSS